MEKDALWGDEKKIVFEDCVANVCRYMNLMKKKGKTYTAFDGSTALAIVFNLEKEETIKDIIKYRELGNVFGEE